MNVQPIPIELAQSHLSEIIEKLSPNEEVVLTRGNKPVATLKASPPTSREPPRLGTLKGTILHIAPDFDDVPEGFEEYLP
jgi:antitoxin (DNA-binding transcriptional repressor) of toxin-antitoxin stability system